MDTNGHGSMEVWIGAAAIVEIVNLHGLSGKPKNQIKL